MLIHKKLSSDAERSQKKKGGNSHLTVGAAGFKLGMPLQVFHHSGDDD